MDNFKTFYVTTECIFALRHNDWVRPVGTINSQSAFENYERYRRECLRVEYIGIKSNFHYNPYPITWSRLPGRQEMARALFRADPSIASPKINCVLYSCLAYTLKILRWKRATRWVNIFFCIKCMLAKPTTLLDQQTQISKDKCTGWKMIHPIMLINVSIRAGVEDPIWIIREYRISFFHIVLTDINQKRKY